MSNLSKRSDEFRRLLQACQGYFVTAAIFSLAINLLYLAGPLFMLQVYDRVISSGSEPNLRTVTRSLTSFCVKLPSISA